MGLGLAIGLIAAGTALNTIGSIQQGQAQSDMYSFQADMANKQGELAELQARQQAAEVTKQEIAVKSKQRAQAAAMGVDLSSGSFMDILNETATQAQKERENVLRAGALNRASYLADASGYSMASSSSKIGGWLNAGSSFLTGSGTIMSMGDRAGWFDD